MKKFSLALGALFSLFAACSDGSYGATPGGVQDMRLARESIANGRVPAPEAFVVEGMFSEHDLPLAGEPCNDALCLRAAGGVAPDLDNAQRGYVQIGLSSAISPNEYRRGAHDYIAVVDVSGSMGWQSGEIVDTPGELSRALLRKINDELNANDRIAIVTFGGSVQTRLPLTRGDRHDDVEAVIRGLDTDGSTNMEAGLRAAYALARGAENARVLLFTDVQPNVGATGESEFEQMAADAAEEGTGTTVFAAGLGIGQELLIAMSHLEGGNAYSVITQPDVERVMDESFAFLADPVASNLVVDVEITSELDNAGRTFGFPAADDREDIGMEVKSVFLSKRRGALLLEVAGDLSDGFKLRGSLSFTDAEGERVERSLEVAHSGEELDDRGHNFDQRSVAKTTALALLVTGMRESAELYGNSENDAAVARMEVVHARIDADATKLEDEALGVEVELAAALLELMRQSAPQDSFYGG